MFNPLEVFKLKAIKSYFSSWEQSEDVFLSLNIHNSFSYFCETQSFFFNEFIFELIKYYVNINRFWYFANNNNIIKGLMGDHLLFNSVFFSLSFLEIFFFFFYCFIVIICCVQFVWESFVFFFSQSFLFEKFTSEQFFFNFSIKQYDFFNFFWNEFEEGERKFSSLFFAWQFDRTKKAGYSFLDFGWFSWELLSEKFLLIKSTSKPTKLTAESAGVCFPSELKFKYWNFNDLYFDGYNALVESWGFYARRVFFFFFGLTESFNYEALVYLLRGDAFFLRIFNKYLTLLSENPVSFSNFESYLTFFFFKSWAIFPFFMFNFQTSSFLSFFFLLLCFLLLYIFIFSSYLLKLYSSWSFNLHLWPFFEKQSRYINSIENIRTLFDDYFFSFFFFLHNFILVEQSFIGYNILQRSEVLDFNRLFYRNALANDWLLDGAPDQEVNLAMMQTAFTVWIKLVGCHDMAEWYREFSEDPSLELKIFKGTNVFPYTNLENIIVFNPFFSTSFVKKLDNSKISFFSFLQDVQLFLNFDILISDFFFFLSQCFFSLFLLIKSVCILLLPNFWKNFDFLGFLEMLFTSAENNYGFYFFQILFHLYNQLNLVFNFCFLNFGYNFCILFFSFFSFLFFFFYNNFVFFRIKETFFFFYARLIFNIILKIITDILTHSKGKIYFLVLLLFLFFFIVFLNFFGLIPYSFAITSYFSVTFFFSFSFFFVLFFIGILMHGIQVLNLFIPPGTPFIILPLLFIIEVISYFARIFSLAIRLFANITAGHILLYIFSWFVSMLFDIIGFSVFGFFLIVALWVLESFISILQAYVFVVLITLYLNEILYLEH